MDCSAGLSEVSKLLVTTVVVQADLASLIDEKHDEKLSLKKRLLAGALLTRDNSSSCHLNCRLYCSETESTLQRRER